MELLALLLKIRHMQAMSDVMLPDWCQQAVATDSGQASMKRAAAEGRIREQAQYALRA